MDSQIKIWDLKVGHGRPCLQPRVGALAPVWCDEVLMAPCPHGCPESGETGAVCVTHSRCSLGVLGWASTPVLPAGCSP